MRAALLVTTGALLISFAPVFVRLADVPPTTAGIYRMLFGTITLIILLWANPKMRAGLGTGWWASLLVGALFAVDLWFWHRSIHYIGPGLATLLGNFQVFILTFVGVVWLRERVGWRFSVGLAFACIGLWLLFGREWGALTPEFRLGILFGFGTATAYAFYILALRGFQIRHPGMRPEARLLQVTLLCGLLLTSVALGEGADFRIPDGRSLASLAALGVFCQVGGWICISRGMPYLGAALIGLILLLQPSGSMIWDSLFFGLRLTGWETLGVLLALLGIYFGLRSAARRTKPAEALRNP